MIWLWLACSFGEDASHIVFEQKEKAPSEQALAGINHLQEKQATMQQFQHVQVWDPQNSSEGAFLASLFNGTVVRNQKELQQQHLFLVILEDNLKKTHPYHPNTVAILKGEWSEQSKGRLISNTIGIASMISSTKRYCSPENSSIESQLTAVAVDISMHFKLPIHADAKLQSSIDVGLWGRVNPQWLLPEAADIRQRWNPQQVPSDPLERLVGFRYGYTNTQIHILTQDGDPWVRAQAVRQSNDLTDVEHLIEDDSSLVKVTAGHRLGELLKANESEAGCQLAKRLIESTDAYVRWKGAYALRYCPRASSALVGLFSDVDIDVQREAVLSLQYHPDAIHHFDAIQRMTTQENSFVRRWAWSTLSKMPHPDMQQILEQCMQSEPALLVQEVCSDGLNRLGVRVNRPMYLPPKASDIENLDTVRSHPDPTFRKDAAKFLVNAVNGERVLNVLMQDPDGEVRKTAVEALGFRQSPLVWEALQDSDPDVIVTALEAIRIGRVSGDLALINPFLFHVDTEIRLRAVEVWTTFHTTLNTAQQQTLQSLMSDHEERIRAAVVSAFPTWVSENEPSMWVRLSSVRGKPMSSLSRSKDSIIQMYLTGEDEQSWVDGLIQEQDDLVHEIYSWNDPSDKPQSHRALRPPRFAPYGHPNRG